MLSIMEKILFLKTASVFQGMNSEQLKLISGITTEEDINRGEELFRQGDLGDKMYIIISGNIEVLEQSGETEQRIAVKVKTELLGEFAVLDDETRSLGARAIDHVKVLSVEKEELKELIREYPELAFEIFKVLIKTNRETNIQLRELSNEVRKLKNDLSKYKRD